MMPLSLFEKVLCGLLMLAIVCVVGHGLWNFVHPLSIVQQREAMQSTLGLFRALGLAGAGR